MIIAAPTPPAGAAKVLNMNLNYLSDVLDQFYILFSTCAANGYFIFIGIFFLILCVIQWLLKWGS